MTQPIQTDLGGLVKEKSYPFDFLGICRQRLLLIFYGSLLSSEFLILLFVVFSYTANSKISPKSPLPNRPITFLDIAALAHLDAVNTYGGDLQKDFIIETTGNGSIIFDFDNDGWPDIFLPTGSTVPGSTASPAPGNRLYHNNRDGTFTDVSEKARIARSGWAQGGCVGDYDNDGYLDLVVTYWGQNALYHNNGDGSFTDVSQTAGLKTDKAEWSTGCSFIDYDHDGKADLFIVRYVDFTYDSVPKKGQGQCVPMEGH